MARLWSSGFELNSTSSNVEITGQIGAAIDTTIVRSGTYSIRTAEAIEAFGDSAWRYEFASSNLEDGLYFRFYVRIAAYPNQLHNSFIRLENTTGGAIKASIRINSTGTLELWNDEDAVQIGSDSSALSLNTWYRIEFKLDTTTLSSTAIEGMIDGTSFASGTINLTAGIGSIRCGERTTSTTTYDYYWDDIAINDDSGSFQNSWPGDGSIIHLKPNADGDNSGWTGSDGDQVNNYLLVDEVTPNDATDFVENTGVSQIDDYNLEASGLTDETITVVQVGVRAQVETGAAASFKLRIKASSGGTVEEGANIFTSGGWATNTHATVKNYSLTLYDLPGASTTAWTPADLDAAQIGMNYTGGGTSVNNVSTIWLLVDYTAAAPEAATWPGYQAPFGWQ